MVHQLEGERNYHIFYQILYGGQKDLHGLLDLEIYFRFDRQERAHAVHSV